MTVSAATVQVRTEAASSRLLALDMVRGWVMLAMLLSHSAWWIHDFEYRVAFGWDNMIVPALGTVESWIGFVLQIASPAFFLLGGFSAALFVASRQRRGWTQWQITRFLLVRGGLLILLDLTVMNIDLNPLSYHTRLSVLTGIGLCLWLLAALRGLPPRLLLLVMVAVLVGTQAWYYLNDWPRQPSLLRAALLAPSLEDGWYVQFPALPWLPVILLGYVLGGQLAQGKIRLSSASFRLGVVLLALWIVVVWVNGFGNLYTAHRFIFGTHPPDLAYLFLYGGATLLLIALHAHFAGLSRGPLAWGVTLLGQSALFFYLAHVRVIEALTPLALELPLSPLEQSLLITICALPLMLALCWAYRSLKRQHPTSVLQYL